MKKNLRSILRARRDSLTIDEISEKSRQITDILVSSESFKQCSSLYTYLDVRNEVCTKSLIEYCFDIGKPVYVPFVVESDMFFSKISDFSQLKTGVFGILEPIFPKADEPDSKSLFVVPGVGFDRRGHRLGYGAGYYDKYLCSREFMGLIGVCFDIQLIDEIPSEKTDVSMDAILTENGWIYPKNRGKNDG